MNPEEDANSISVQADAFNESVMDRVGVLETDHPLLERFQSALKAHLLKVKDQLEEEVAELNHRLEQNEKESEEVGAELYDLQEEIDNQKELLEIYSKEIFELAAQRQQEEKLAAQYRKEFEEQQQEVRDFEKMHKEHMMELDNLTVLESELAKWAQEIMDEIAVAKRVASKDAKDKLMAAEEKRRSDLLVHNLSSEIKRKEFELKEIEDKIKEQDEKRETINRSLADANTDLEALQHEHKCVSQAWGEVIVAIQQRDRVLVKTREELGSIYEEHKVIKSKTEITKKTAAKEMEQNEKLAGFKNRIQGDINSLEKQVRKEQEDEDKLKRDLDHYALILEQTEADILKAQQEGLLIENHLKSLRQTLEKQNRKKFELEDQILELLQDQLTTDKAGEAQGKLLADTTEKRRELEINMEDTENRLSVVLLDLEKWRSLVETSKDVLSKVKVRFLGREG
uniref:Uncharacterized protein n=1 Tax=Anopheles maculatus TaxID=74869 RepID=A0A182SBI8_9DIPT